ncbi:MAG: NEL-type E3 ubiquitin ligase domain-containing protein, partial [Pseudomonas sp.]
SVVDALVPAHLEDRSTKLWNQDLTPFRSAQPVPQATRDTLGVHRLAEQSWIEMDGQYYAVAERVSTGQWQLRPQDGHGPLLRHNGAGAWRLWCEQPAEWEETQRMFRRLGGGFGELDAEQIDLVLSIHGLGSDDLRALHVYAQAPSAELQDSVMRIRLDQRIRDLVRCLRSGESVEDITVLHHAQGWPGAAELSDQNLAELAWSERRLLFQRLYDSMQDSDGPGIAALRRVFPSLHSSAANVLVGRASTADRQRLLDTGRVPLHLAEAARASVQQIRVARVYEAFVIDTSQNADVARAALGMLGHLPGSAGVQWRLIEGYAAGPQLLVAGEGPQVFSLIHRNGTFQLLDGNGSSIGDAGELFEVMATAYDEPQREAMGIADPFAHNLRVLLGRQAVRRREEVALLLSARGRNGWFQPPQRLADGRIGYPLSGRGSAGSARRGRPQSLFAMVRALYPTFTDAQVIAWMNDLQHAGIRIETELARLAQELELLNSSLQRWSSLPDSAGVRDDRRYFSDSLVNCWQRTASLGPSTSEHLVNYRFTLYGAEIGALPELPAQVSFPHVFELALLGMGLQELPDSFMRAFSHLRILELPGNRLNRVPQHLVQLEHLRELDLFNNQIVLDEAQATILSNCESLEYLNLSYNPLGRSFSLRRLIRLRRLHLRQTGINRLPYAILDCPDLLLADLRENQITELSEHFYHSPPWLRRVILLADNPLAAQEALRLQASLLDAGAVAHHAVSAEDFVTTRQRWLDATNSLTRDEWSAHWEDLENQPGSNDFFDMLRRLLETPDFQQSGQALANRVFTMIRAMNDHASLREALLNQVTQNLTCQDSVALCFSNLELRMLVWRAESSADNPQAALLYLGRQFWRLDEVDRIALEDIQARRASGSDPDQIEVALAYRLALRDALDLPAQPSDMLFGEVAGLDAQRIARALARVEAAETPEQLAHSLVAREFWQEHLLRAQRTRFDTIDAPFHDRLAVLMDAETVPEGERVAQMNRIRDARLEAQRALMLELTLTLLRGTSGHSIP